VLVGIILAVVFVTNNKTPVAANTTVNNVECNSSEQLAVHYHAHLQILYNGQPVKVPTNIGIQTTCLYWLHTHNDSGTIHVESPVSQKTRVFTLGDFFQVWGQPLSSTQVATLKVGPDQQLKMYLKEDKGSWQPYTGDPRKIPLKSHELIALEITPPDVNPPPDFSFQQGE